MAVEFKLPELGENIEQADILEVLVEVGETVQVDQGVLEIETDKATIEVPSDVAGVVKEIKVKAGDTARVGQVIMTVEAVEAKAEQKPEEPEAPRAAPAESPAKKEAPKAERDKPRETREPEKRPERETPAQAEARKRSSVIPAPPPPARPVGSNGPAEPRKTVPAAPSTRRIAREIGVNIEQVRGTGPGGRISVEDVKAHAKMLLQAGAPSLTAPTPRAAAPPTAAADLPPLPDFSRFGETSREKMSGIRRKTAEQMTLAWRTIPQVTQFDKADVTELEAMRRQINQRSPHKITVTAILLKVLAAALKRFPNFNASIDLAAEEVVYKQYYNIGVAVDTERGLLVPVVRDVYRKNVVELAGDLNDLAARARDKKISPDDLQGACITITNLGGIGGHAFTPIVNPPEVAILGVSRSTQEPVFWEGKFRSRLMLPLCLSYDHRLIDGADAARFLRWVCEAVENPAVLAFEG